MAVGILLMSANEAYADSSLGCGSNLLSEGDSRYEVRSACGASDDRQSRTEWRTVRENYRVPCGEGKTCLRSRVREIEVQIYEWTYDFGPRKFIQFLTFEQGKLVNVKSGGYGSDKKK